MQQNRAHSCKSFDSDAGHEWPARRIARRAAFGQVPKKIVEGPPSFFAASIATIPGLRWSSKIWKRAGRSPETATSPLCL